MGPLSYIEAKKLVAETNSSISIDITLCMSGTAEPLIPFIKGEVAKFGFSSNVNFLPFGTLLQHLNSSNSVAEDNEIWLVFPWDIVPITDWRTGAGSLENSLDQCIDQAAIQIDKICSRSPKNIVFVDAPIPPLGIDASNSKILGMFLKFYLSKVGSRIISCEFFSLDKYLTTGFPFDGASLGIVAQNLMDYLAVKNDPKKVLITDLDNTFWSGVAAEDGPLGVKMGPEGDGFKHFIYQNYLSKIQSLGVVVAAVTRNSDSTINEVFDKTYSSFKKDQFSVIVASYESKSAQIKEISNVMNLGLDSFVFIDDNVIELHEVTNALPKVVSIRFPKNISEFPSFMETISNLFSRKHITKEDRDRTEKYKLMLSTLKARRSTPSDLAEFLRSLNMKLFIEDKTRGDWVRAYQLINKTNQFNANGARISYEDFSLLIQNGGRVYTARLVDSSGDHGEILAFLLDSANKVVSFVMSCRVFQRNVECVFLYWYLSMSGVDKVNISIFKTSKNEPFFNFLNVLDVVAPIENEISLNAFDIQKKLEKFLGLIEVFYDSK